MTQALTAIRHTAAQAFTSAAAYAAEVPSFGGAWGFVIAGGPDPRRPRPRTGGPPHRPARRTPPSASTTARPTGAFSLSPSGCGSASPASATLFGPDGPGLYRLGSAGRAARSLPAFRRVT